MGSVAYYAEIQDAIDDHRLDQVVKSVTDATKRLSQHESVNSSHSSNFNNTRKNDRKRKKHSRDTIGPWKLGKTLGKGSSGRVRLAKNIETGKLAAIKIVPKKKNKVGGKRLSNNTGKLYRSYSSIGEARVHPSEKYIDSNPYGIEREIVIMKLLSHPNVMGLYEVWENNNELYLVLEYVDGGELFDYLVSKGKLSELEAVRYFKQIIQGISYCHSFNICHRDLKPENLLLDKKRKLIKIADFGMAALQISNVLLKTSCGSPHYASPEIVKGKPYNGSSSDIWSCGIILFALLTGHLPFNDDNIKNLLIKVQNGQYRMPQYLSPEAKNLISRLLVIDPDRRISTKQILEHPLIKKYDNQFNLKLEKELSKKASKNYLDLLNGNFSSANLSIDTDLLKNEIDKTNIIQLRTRTDIDETILKHLEILWHGTRKEIIVSKLLQKSMCEEKLIYSLLWQYNKRNLMKSVNSDENSSSNIALSSSISTSFQPSTASSSNPNDPERQAPKLSQNSKFSIHSLKRSQTEKDYFENREKRTLMEDNVEVSDNTDKFEDGHGFEDSVIHEDTNTVNGSIKNDRDNSFDAADPFDQMVGADNLNAFDQISMASQSNAFGDSSTSFEAAAKSGYDKFVNQAALPKPIPPTSLLPKFTASSSRTFKKSPSMVSSRSNYSLHSSRSKYSVQSLSSVRGISPLTPKNNRLSIISKTVPTASPSMKSIHSITQQKRTLHNSESKRSLYSLTAISKKSLNLNEFLKYEASDYDKLPPMPSLDSNTDFETICNHLLFGKNLAEIAEEEEIESNDISLKTSTIEKSSRPEKSSFRNDNADHLSRTSEEQTLNSSELQDPHLLADKTETYVTYGRSTKIGQQSNQEERSAKIAYTNFSNSELEPSNLSESKNNLFSVSEKLQNLKKTRQLSESIPAKASLSLLDPRRNVSTPSTLKVENLLKVVKTDAQKKNFKKLISMPRASSNLNGIMNQNKTVSPVPLIAESEQNYRFKDNESFISKSSLDDGNSNSRMNRVHSSAKVATNMLAKKTSKSIDREFEQSQRSDPTENDSTDPSVLAQSSELFQTKPLLEMPQSFKTTTMTFENLSAILNAADEGTPFDKIIEESSTTGSFEKSTPIKLSQSNTQNVSSLQTPYSDTSETKRMSRLTKQSSASRINDRDISSLSYAMEMTTSVQTAQAIKLSAANGHSVTEQILMKESDGGKPSNKFEDVSVDYSTTDASTTTTSMSFNDSNSEARAHKKAVSIDTLNTTNVVTPTTDVRISLYVNSNLNTSLVLPRETTEEILSKFKLSPEKPTKSNYLQKRFSMVPATDNENIISVSQSMVSLFKDLEEEQEDTESALEGGKSSMNLKLYVETENGNKDSKPNRVTMLFDDDFEATKEFVASMAKTVEEPYSTSNSFKDKKLEKKVLKRESTIENQKNLIDQKSVMESAHGKGAHGIVPVLEDVSQKEVAPVNGQVSANKSVSPRDSAPEKPSNSNSKADNRMSKDYLTVDYVKKEQVNRKPVAIKKQPEAKPSWINKLFKGFKANSTTGKKLSKDHTTKLSFDQTNRVTLHAFKNLGITYKIKVSIPDKIEYDCKYAKGDFKFKFTISKSPRSNTIVTLKQKQGNRESFMKFNNDVQKMIHDVEQN